MSVFPVKLPLYPILNASDSVQRLLDKDAEAARVWPEKDSKGAERVRAEPGGAVDPSSRATPVEGVSVPLDPTAVLAGGEQQVDPDDATPTAAGQRLDMRS